MPIRLNKHKDKPTVLIGVKEDNFKSILFKVKNAILKISKKLKVMSKEGLISKVIVKILNQAA